MHRYDADAKALGEAVLDYTQRRLRMDPVPLDGPRTPAELEEVAGATITAKGLGGDAALTLFTGELAPSCISTDHPRYLSFIPCAPTEASTLFDLVVGASSIYGGSWLEGDVMDVHFVGVPVDDRGGSPRPTCGPPWSPRAPTR